MLSGKGPNKRLQSIWSTHCLSFSRFCSFSPHVAPWMGQTVNDPLDRGLPMGGFKHSSNPCSNVEREGKEPQNTNPAYKIWRHDSPQKSLAVCEQLWSVRTNWQQRQHLHRWLIRTEFKSYSSRGLIGLIENQSIHFKYCNPSGWVIEFTFQSSVMKAF